MRAVSRFAIIGMVGSLAAACSTDRFAGGNPFSNPFPSAGQGADPIHTGSINREPPAAAMPRSTIDAQPLPPIGTSSAAPYEAPSHAMPSRPRTASGGPGWSTTGGTTVIVGPGETVTTLSSRYGVPADAILSANGLKHGDVTGGRRVVIPVYSARGDAGVAPARRAEAPAPVRYTAPPAPQPAGRVVASSRMDVARSAPRTIAEAAPPKPQMRPGRPVVAQAPEPTRAAPAQRVAEARQQVLRAPPPVPARTATKPETRPARVAEREIVLPARKVVASAQPAAASKPVEPAKPAASRKEPVRVASVEPAKTVPTRQAAAESPKTVAREPESTGAIAPSAPAKTTASGGTTDFRWPARGRVIAGFGGSGGNEGINIAVPEGTPVKAAGDGTVAYAGSEVKGYGNLVLIRHDNGYVSAYANNGQIDVKRGQRVSRGQSIARSGQTGNVTSPQLHFEIRKGSTPVDPMKYLASAE
ncbi:LysM domain-containing protein [Enterovirga rhinocerotis]|uniref:LysM domain-containing protein n=2 Tax=Enterovirga rhinocerotis TaxID=1339210 RepID=A0A4R7CBG3_9HYPH|nr:LysM domain-containing protein [Enterovirga rhinocerotis]